MVIFLRAGKFEVKNKSAQFGYVGFCPPECRMWVILLPAQVVEMSCSVAGNIKATEYNFN
jgi:hypothetical protein